MRRPVARSLSRRARIDELSPNGDILTCLPLEGLHWNTSCATPLATLEQHRVAVAHEPVALRDRVGVGAADRVVPGKRAAQHQPRRSWRVEIGDGPVDRAEPVAGGD